MTLLTFVTFLFLPFARGSWKGKGEIWNEERERREVGPGNVTNVTHVTAPLVALVPAPTSRDVTPSARHRTSFETSHRPLAAVYN